MSEQATIFINGEEVTVEEYNSTHSWPINGERCEFCGCLKHIGSDGKYHCFNLGCYPEKVREKRLKRNLKKIRLVIV